ncbi:MAG: GNAT family N-acetyltransferase [Microscillaceae bacterium]|nr:GNAT family N-acetyltransferase [Microscillaceae bacterium]
MSKLGPRGAATTTSSNGFPLLLGNRHPQDPTYLSSPLVQYFDLAREEIEIELKGKQSWRAWVAPSVLSLMRRLFEALSFERVVFVNNWLLSTNLYPVFETSLLSEALTKLVKAFPHHAIVFRSVNTQTEADILQVLLSLGFKAVISRPVLMLNPQEGQHRKKRMFKMDEKLWARQNEYYWEPGQKVKPAEIPRILDLYEALYRHKYSAYNPAYRGEMVATWLRSGIMEFQILRREGEIYGFTAFWKRKGILTTPFIGYDATRPQQEGLYRFVNLRLMQEAIQQNLWLNMSSGAAHFKRLRGGQPCLEYNMVYTKHLPLHQRLPWELYSQISEKIAIPAIQKYNL